MSCVIKIGKSKRQWLLGAVWYREAEKLDKETLKDEAEKFSTPLVCNRESESVIQNGFSDKIDGVKGDIYSLAAFMADAKEQPWLGIFEIADDLFWYIAVRDDHAILPDGDIVGDRQTVDAQRASHAGMGHWNFVEGDLDDLQKLMAEVKTKATLFKDVNATPLPLLNTIVAVLGAVAIVVGCYFAIDSYQATKLAIIRAAEQTKRDKLVTEHDMRDEAERKNAPSPVMLAANPTLFLSVCGDVLMHARLSIDGWTLSKVGCDDKQAFLLYKRMEGATVFHRPEGFLFEDGEQIEQDVAFSIPASGVNDSIKIGTAITLMFGFAQSSSYKLQISLARNVPKDAEKATAVSLEQPHADFTLTSPSAPFNIDFSSVPGLRITSVLQEGSDWTLKGVVYGKR